MGSHFPDNFIRTRVNGAMWLRVVLMNPMTRLRDLRTLPEELERNADATVWPG